MKTKARPLPLCSAFENSFLFAYIPPILRSEYISLLEKAHEDDGLFIKFIADRELESQRDFLRLLHIPLPKLGQDNSGIKMV